MRFGSVCSGIEAASVALNPIGFETAWVSEIAEFPSDVIRHHHPTLENFGDMLTLPERIRSGIVPAPDMLCGGTPCQSFSLAGWRNGLVDERGLLTLKFIEVANAIDEIRDSQGKDQGLILWENVEGVLTDKTNAFGNFISALAGCKEAFEYHKRWPSAGVLYGPQRVVSWRVLDARFFGLPQQRRRLFVIASGHTMPSHRILFELIKHDQVHLLPKNGFSRKPNKATLSNNDVIDIFGEEEIQNPKVDSLTGVKAGQRFEFFRDYTDCLYSAYGTKWNGNAAAYNGSLYVSQNDRIRRFTPSECERLMGFPGDYTDLHKATDTGRYKAIGNSWAIPVIRWIGERILKVYSDQEKAHADDIIDSLHIVSKSKDLSSKLISLDPPPKVQHQGYLINTTTAPNDFKIGCLLDIVDPDAPHKFYLSAAGVAGILRRKGEKDIKMNKRLESIMKTYV